MQISLVISDEAISTAKTAQVLLTFITRAGCGMPRRVLTTPLFPIVYHKWRTNASGFGKKNQIGSEGMRRRFAARTMRRKNAKRKNRRHAALGIRVRAACTNRPEEMLPLLIKTVFWEKGTGKFDMVAFVCHIWYTDAAWYERDMPPYGRK
ncbi:MAG TPA: hypothetical protein H9665_03555 [Firmicutes bacterium]|nr:hypothetical protein [Bacillota bacterium]